MKLEDKSDRQLRESDRYRDLFNSSTFSDSNLLDSSKFNCCWSGCWNLAIHFDSQNFGYCLSHLPQEAWQC